MADIQIAVTGEVVWGVDDGIAKLLLGAFPEHFYRVKKRPTEPAKPVPPNYTVGTTPGGSFAIIRPTVSTTEYISMPPEHVKNKYPDCPDAVIKRWAETDWRHRAKMGS